MISGFKIVVAISGFVYIGNVVTMENGVLISGANNIRTWGTTKGLGQLALHGPTKDTVLDEVGELFIPSHAVISLITTDASKW